MTALAWCAAFATVVAATFLFVAGAFWAGLERSERPASRRRSRRFKRV